MSVDMKDYIAYQQGYEAGKRDAADAIEFLIKDRDEWKETAISLKGEGK